MYRLLILLVVFVSVHFPQQKIPLTISEYGLIFLEASVNDVKGKFILDTGAGAHVLSKKFFDKIKNKTKEDGIYTGFRHNGERLDLIVYQAESISVGSLTQSQPFVGVYPPLNEYGIDGLVSLKLFEETAFTIDFINNELILETDKSLSELTKNSEEFPILFDRERDKVLDLFVTITLNDSVSLQAEFDTGAGFNAFYLNKFYADKLNLQLDTLNRAIIEKLSYNGSEIVFESNKTITVKDDLIYEGLIGSGIFRNAKLTIDIPNSRILVKSNK